MSNSSDHFPEAKLLSVSNVQTWDVYIQEHLIGYSQLGKAIRTNTKYVLLRPEQDDLVPGTTQRLYKARTDPTRFGELFPSGLTAYRADLTRYNLLNDHRLQEESKLCTFLMKSFSEEAKKQYRITSRSNRHRLIRHVQDCKSNVLLLYKLRSCFSSIHATVPDQTDWYIHSVQRYHDSTW